MSKGWISPLVLITLSIIGLFFYFQFKKQTLTQITPPTAQLLFQGLFDDWKSYRNAAHSFTIRYPRNWFVREYGHYAANFQATNPNFEEASSAAIKVRYASLAEAIDLKGFEKIFDAQVGENIYEPLDVISIINKIRNFEIGGYPAVEYMVNRKFTALEGPRTEFSHVYEIDKDGAILKFASNAQTREEHLVIDPVFQQMISTIKF